MTAPAKPPFIVVTRYAADDGKVIIHAYGGPWVNNKDAYAARKKIQADVANDPRVELHVVRVLPVGRG